MSLKKIKKSLLVGIIPILLLGVLSGCGENSNESLESEIDLTDASTSILQDISDDGATENATVESTEEVFAQPTGEEATFPDVTVDLEAKTAPEIYSDGTYFAEALYLTPDTTETVTVSITLQNDDIVNSIIRSTTHHPNTKLQMTEDIIYYYQLEIADKEGKNLTSLPESPYIVAGLENAVEKALQVARDDFIFQQQQQDQEAELY